MLAVAVVEPNKLEVVNIPRPTPGPYEALVHTEIAALCNATDRKLIEGHFPGYAQYPLLLGHEGVGTVVAVGEKVRSFKVGDRVIGGLLLRPTDPAYASGWGGFAEYTLAGDHVAMVEDGTANAAGGWVEVHEIMRALPRALPLEDAVLLCTWREVYAAFDDFSLKPGDDMVVFGAGPVGLSFAKFGRLLGLGEIYTVDPLPEKRQKAVEMGATGAFAPGDPALEALVQQRGQGFDAVIDAVGKESIINTALRLITFAGMIGVYGVIDTPAITVEKDRGPYNFNLLIHQWPTRYREAAAQQPLIEWIEAGKLSHTDFVSAEFPIEQVAQAFELSKTGNTIKTLLRF